MPSGNGARKLYVGMHDGVCILTSTDGGKTWQQGNVTPIEHASSRFSVSPSDPSRAYLAAYESGVYRTNDGGFTWDHLSSPPCEYAHSVVVHPGDPDLVHVGGEPASIFRSNNGGETWDDCLAFKQVPESRDWFFHSETRYSHVRDMRLAPHNPDWIYAGIEVGGIVRTRDGGNTWQQLSGTDADVHYLNMSPSRPATVYAATAAGPYRSDDAGDNWQAIHNGLERHYTVPIMAAPDDDRHVLVAVANNAGRKGAQAYKSSNAGDDWQRLVGLGSDDDMAVAFAWDPINPEQVYVGTDSGRLFASVDRGRTWSPLEIKLPSLAVGALSASPAA